MRNLALLLCIALCVSMSAAEPYIVPVFGAGVNASDGTYASVLTVINPTPHEAKLNVVQVLPLVAEPCIHCNTLPFTQIIQPSYAQAIEGLLLPAKNGRYLLLGAIVLEADQPLEIGSFSYRDFFPPKSGMETVEVARGWIPGGRSMIPLAVRGEGETANLFLVNPNDEPLTFEYSVLFGTTIAEVAAQSSAVVPLRYEFYCPDGCAWGSRPVGEGVPVFVTADAPYMAAVSSRSPWLNITRIARPLQ